MKCCLVADINNTTTTTDNMTSVVTNDVTITLRGDDGKSSDSQNIPVIVIVFCLSVLVIVVICLVVAFVLSRYVMIKNTLYVGCMSHLSNTWLLNLPIAD